MSCSGWVRFYRRYLGHMPLIQPLTMDVDGVLQLVNSRSCAQCHIDRIGVNHKATKPG